MIPTIEHILHFETLAEFIDHFKLKQKFLEEYRIDIEDVDDEEEDQIINHYLSMMQGSYYFYWKPYVDPPDDRTGMWVVVEFRDFTPSYWRRVSPQDI